MLALSWDKVRPIMGLSISMTKAQYLAMSAAWLNMAHKYLFSGMIGKADRCIDISIRLTNQACLIK